MSKLKIRRQSVAVAYATCNLGSQLAPGEGHPTLTGAPEEADPQVCCAANSSQPKPQQMLSATQIGKPATKINKGCIRPWLAPLEQHLRYLEVAFTEGGTH